MSKRAKIAVWAVFSFLVVAAVAILSISFYRAPERRGLEALEGAVIAGSENPRKQAPIPGVEITATALGYTTSTKSQSSGRFRLPLAPEWKPKQQVTLTFRAENFQPLQMTVVPGTNLVIARLVLMNGNGPNSIAGTQTAITNVRIRYSTEFITTTNVGSISTPLDVANTGNLPCESSAPCSPDNRWKATVTTKTFDAGKDNQFVNMRVSCMAGPCPFTQVEDDAYTRPSRIVTVKIRNWSDAATYLIEAEVSRTQRNNFTREAYPAIFGQAMTFTLPAAAQGLYIEADVNGHPIVFPVGPALQLTWATCDVETSGDGSKLFRCELKTGYHF